MTQAQAAAAPATPEASPPGSQSAPLSLPPELLQDLAPGLRPEVPPVQTSDEDDDADDLGSPSGADLDADALTAGEVPPEEDAGEDAATEESSPETEIATWADALLDNPKAATRMPRRLQPAVFAEYNNRLQVAYDAGLRNGQQQAAQMARMSTLQEQARVIEALGDPESETYSPSDYAEAVANFPGGRRAYHRVVEGIVPVPAGSPEAFQQRAADIVRELSAFPAAVEELRSRWNYSANEDGLRRLALDVGALLERSRNAGPNEAAKKLAQRRDGLNGLKAAPKPNVSEGRTAPIARDPTPDEIRKFSAEYVAEQELLKPGTAARWMKLASGQK